ARRFPYRGCARGRDHSRSLRPSPRLVGLRRCLARRVPARHGGDSRRQRAVLQARRAAPAQPGSHSAAVRRCRTCRSGGARSQSGVAPPSPWPDVPAGLARLKRGFLLAPVSNGNISLMVDLARRNNFPWDAILGAEIARDYKRKPRVYLAACEAFDLPPGDCMMVAAHSDDLQAAAKCGLRTAHGARPNELGPGIGDVARTVTVD